MSKIAVVAFETNPAVCSSMMMHVELMADCGHSITMLISSKIEHGCFDNCIFFKHSFSSNIELKRQLKTGKFDFIWCTSHVYVNYLRFKLHIKTPIILWQQGDGPSESFMHHHSSLRSTLIRASLYVAFRVVKGVVFVSNTMANYYKQKYNYNRPYIVVPCLSEFSNYKIDAEKIPNSFVYIGGLSVWQCVDEMLVIYKKIRTENSIFHIITGDTEAAKDKVMSIIGDTKNIEIYSISDRSIIPGVLSQFQYGFLIRSEDIVNYVSSPIKFLEYLSCGVNVIMTKAVPEYSKIIEEYKIGSVIEIDSAAYNINKYNNNCKEVYDSLFRRDVFLKRYLQLLAQ